MTYNPNVHPDQLHPDRLLGRTQGDAMQLASLVREHGPDILNELLDYWGPAHTRRVTIALAAAVDEDRTPQELWGWLDGPNSNRSLSTSIPNSQLWKRRDQQIAPDYQGPGQRQYSDATRAQMAERGRQRLADINRQRKKKAG